MTAIHRRQMLRVMLGSAVVATAGLAMLLIAAESAPITMSKSLPAPTENLVEEAVWVRRRHWVGRRHWVHRRHWVGHRHWGVRRRRWACWWLRGRRICGWRWF
jgi:hypothetical protein